MGFPNRQADRHPMIISNHEKTSLSASRDIEATVQERHYPHILLHRRTVSTRKLKMHNRDPKQVRANEHYIRCSLSTRLNGYAFLDCWDTRKQHAYRSSTLPDCISPASHVTSTKRHAARNARKRTSAHRSTSYLTQQAGALRLHLRNEDVRPTRHLEKRRKQKMTTTLLTVLC